MAKVTNISTGPRGAYHKGKLVMAEVGEEIEADDFVSEWFAKADSVSDTDDDGLGSMTVADLKALADAEQIDLGDVTKKADIISAIELAREAAGEGKDAKDDE